MKTKQQNRSETIFHQVSWSEYLKPVRNREALRKKRRALHMTQTKFARLVNVSRQEISHYERGRRGIPDEVMEKADELLDTRTA